MSTLITGATGFIGKRLCEELASQGHDLVVLSRHPKTASSKVSAQCFAWDAEKGPPPETALRGVDAVIHLAGEGIADKRWSPERKKHILDSRILGTRNLMQGLARMSKPPQTIISASAIGFYGDRGDEMLTESSPRGQGFLADVCAAWEAEAEKATIASRITRVRIGVVLGAEGGILKKLTPLFKAGLGGPVGSGRQWMSCIHVEDLVRLFNFILSNPQARGVINGVGPEQVTNRQFSQKLGEAVYRPAFFTAPGFMIKLMLGEMSEIVLGSERVKPETAVSLGFQYHYPTIESALAEILKRKTTTPFKVTTPSSGSLSL